MTALTLQTLLLMLPAFFVGAALACGLRKMLHPAAALGDASSRVDTGTNYKTQPEMPAVKAAPARVTPQPAAPSTAPPVTAAPATAKNRFDDTLNDRPPEQPRPAPPPPPATAAAPASPTVPPPAAPAAPRAAPVPSAPAAAAAVTPPASPAPTIAPTAQVAAAAAAAATAAAAAAAARLAEQARVIVAPPQPAPPAAVSQATQRPQPTQAAQSAAAPSGVVVPIDRDAVPMRRGSDAADDLTRIKGIDPALRAELDKLGVTKFSQIAGWHATDVGEIGRKLGVAGRIAQENWIEQAQILMGGAETHFSSTRAKHAEAAATVSPQPAPTPAAPASQPAVAERAAFADRSDAPRAPVAVAPPAVAPRPTRSPEPPAKLPAAEAAADSPVAMPARDPLQRIRAINAEIERMLGLQGVTRYSHIAGWSQADVSRFDQLLGSEGRIARENWIEQAQILAKGGATPYSREFDRRSGLVAPVVLAPAAAPSAPSAPASPAAPSGPAAPEASARPKNITDAIRANAAAAEGEQAAAKSSIGGLRSVRSDAYRGGAEPSSLAAAAAAAAGSGSAKVVRSAETDDLKRIRGIGVLIERRLNSMGVVSYGQVAEWTADDIERVSSILDFKGRIERENWVEQARILAAGGHTEFSRRVDDGEVGVSRSK